jgi:hypothetical protein
MTEVEFRKLARSKPLRDKFLGEMDKEKGFSVEKLRQAEDSPVRRRRGWKRRLRILNI